MSTPMRRALLRPRRERPSRRAAEPSDEFAPSKPNAHVPLPVRFTFKEERVGLGLRLGPRLGCMRPITQSLAPS